MSSEVEKFIKGESKDSYKYFGAHTVNNGVCFRVYAPNAKQIEVSINEQNYKMDKIDFRGVFETRIDNIKEFDTYRYDVLTQEDLWIRKNDPYMIYHEIGKSAYIEKDQYIFNDEKWISKKVENEAFNACLITDEFKMDDQREFIEYLKKYHYNYLILRPYNEKYLYCVNELFINESSLKNFIDNLHQSNIGVIFDFETDSFFDYAEGLNDFDGSSIYNKKESKYKDVNQIYFDDEKKAVQSYLKSWIYYYLERFHGDGLFINDSNFNRGLEAELDNKIFIYKGNENNQGIASDNFLIKIIDNINKGIDYKLFISTSFENQTYIIYDYDKYLKLIKGNEENKKQIARMLLAFTYINQAYCISVYNRNEEYLMALEKMANLYTSSKALHGKTKSNLLYNGKKNNCFAYEYVSKNDYVLTVVNFSNKEDDKFDLGMQFYGYYTLILDTSDNTNSSELFYTREKKAHNKDIALKMHLKPNQVLIYKRMRDI